MSYTNFDHTLEPNTESHLISGEHDEHYAWNFYGVLYYKDGLFYEDVMRYHAVVDTLKNPVLLDLIDDVNHKYGFE